MTSTSASISWLIEACRGNDGITPMYRRLYESLRDGVLEGRIAAGTRLPSSRTLSAEAGVSRNTVLAAYDQLMAEGYLEGHAGSGTFVARHLPDDMLRVEARHDRKAVTFPHAKKLSARGLALAAIHVSTPSHPASPRAFRTGLPALDAFPFRLWAAIASKVTRAATDDLLAYPDPAGYMPLRRALSEYLRDSRGVRCQPEQVIVVNGSQQALHLCAQTLLDAGDAVWMEDPGYLGARAAFTSAAARVMPVPVDAQGMSLAAASEYAAPALVYVTPSHQFPTGVTMSLTRRLELLETARQHDAWVLEDDYDSEYRYTGTPIPSLQGLDADGRVIYMGTFSKVLFPSVRLGYVVAPANLADAMAKARALIDRGSESITQAVIERFIQEGHFGRHIRRMRSLYAVRQAVLVESAQQMLSGLLDVQPSDAGMSLLAKLPPDVDDATASRRIAQNGVDAQPLSAYCAEQPRESGLVLGYSGVTEDGIRDGVRKIRAALRLRETA